MPKPPLTPKDCAPATPPPAYLAPYCDAVDEHGATFKATLWNSRQWQGRRFEALASLVDFRGRRILDCGSGLGDLAEFLTGRGIAYASYVGLEGVPEIRAAAARRGLPRAEFVLTDFVADAGAFSGSRQADVIVFCGSLNTLDESSALAALDRAWTALPAPATGGAPPALLFNFLSDMADGRVVSCGDTGPARRMSAARLFAWAGARTTSLAFRSDYLPGGHDATIAMWRPTDCRCV